MADMIDQASELASAEAEAGIVRVRRALQPSGATECDDCGEEIGARRLAAIPSATRCIDCQTLAEGGTT